MTIPINLEPVEDRSVKLGVRTACPDDKNLDEALAVIAGPRVNNLEVNTGGQRAGLSAAASTSVR